MALRRGLAFLLAFFCLAALRPLPTARGEEDSVRRERALLIGVDEFVTQPSAYPSSTNNVYAMQEMFQAAADTAGKNSGAGRARHLRPAADRADPARFRRRGSRGRQLSVYQHPRPV